MNLASSWRLPVALAVLAMFAAFVAWPGAGPKSAEANVTSVTPDATLGESGDTIDIDIVGTAGVAVALSVSATGSSTLAPDTCADVDPSCGTPTAAGNPVGWDTVDGAYTATVILTLDCSEPEAVTVTADDEGTTDDTVVYCVPELNDPNVVVEKQADDNAHYDFGWDTSGGNCALVVEGDFVEFDDAGGFDLQDNDKAEFYCENPVSLTVEEQDDYNFVRIDDCEEGDDGIDDISGSSVLFDVSELGAGDTVFCTFVNSEVSATPTVVSGPATSVLIVLSTTTINCGGSTLVQVLPKSATGGPAAAGTTITLTSSLGGSFQPASSVTSLFEVSLANFLYTAPANASGTTTITARAGNATTTAAVQITCQVAAATAVATSAPLSPPSAGDAGLLGPSGSDYLPTALAVAAAAVVLGLTAFARRAAAVTADVADVAIPSQSSQSHRSGGLALLASFVMLGVTLLLRRLR